MIETIEEYLAILKEELSRSDTATMQDALADAEEHLSTALEQIPGSERGQTQAEALMPIIEKYGTPPEIAAAYREIEAFTQPALAELKPATEKSFISSFFSVIADAQAWGALLYLLLSIVIGLVYFSWAVIGLSLSISLLILIIGLPFAVLFLLSVQSIVFIEGRIVQGLLGVRMPRRPLFTNRQGGWIEQVKSLFQETRTWTALVYMVLQLPLGVIYFSVFISLIALAVSLIASPILVLVFNIPLLNFGGQGYYPAPAVLPFIAIGGLLLLIATMHLAKVIGRLHGALAKTLLVGSSRASS